MTGPDWIHLKSECRSKGQVPICSHGVKCAMGAGFVAPLVSAFCHDAVELGVWSNMNTKYVKCKTHGVWHKPDLLDKHWLTLTFDLR